MAGLAGFEQESRQADWRAPSSPPSPRRTSRSTVSVPDLDRDRDGKLVEIVSMTG
jgi:hypothetical protein